MILALLCVAAAYTGGWLVVALYNATARAVHRLAHRTARAGSGSAG